MAAETILTIALGRQYEAGNKWTGPAPQHRKECPLLYPPKSCLRHLTTCNPMAQIAADDLNEAGDPVSFVCVGANDGSDRQYPQDWYTLCWKSATDIDTRDHVDLTDLLHTQSVIAQALTMIEFTVEPGNESGATAP